MSHIYLKVIYPHGGKMLLGSWAEPTELNNDWNAQKDIGWHASLSLLNGAKSVEVKLGDLDKDEDTVFSPIEEVIHAQLSDPELAKRDLDRAALRDFEWENISDDLSQANEVIRALTIKNETFRVMLLTAEALLCDPVAGLLANAVSNNIVKVLNS